MLEVKTYSFQEMCSILNSKTKKSIDAKLKGYKVEFESTGRAPKLTYTIKKINNPFKVFCITELGFNAGTDFNHLQHFMFHFFCDDYFMSMPDERKERMMDNWEYHISRQTIAKYEKQLQEIGAVAKSLTEFKYYFAYKDYISFTDKATYSQAWREYWDMVNSGHCSMEAIAEMRWNYGGVARKQAIYEKNGFWNERIDYLISLFYNRIENELKEK